MESRIGYTYSGVEEDTTKLTIYDSLVDSDRSQKVAVITLHPNGPDFLKPGTRCHVRKGFGDGETCGVPVYSNLSHKFVQGVRLDSGAVKYFDIYDILAILPPKKYHLELLATSPDHAVDLVREGITADMFKEVGE